MDPIETWHDAPTFEAMEVRIKTLEAAANRVVLAYEKYRKRGVLPSPNHYQGWVDSVLNLKSILELKQ